jgi:hypothetical protein
MAIILLLKMYYFLMATFVMNPRNLFLRFLLKALKNLHGFFRVSSFLKKTL